MNISRLESLCKTFGVSSSENVIGAKVREQYEGLCDRFVTDRLGSVFAIKQSKSENAKTLMIASPLDEVGLMISEVKKEGTLSFIPLENIAATSLLHQKVRILTRCGDCVMGVIRSRKKALEDQCEVKGAEDLEIVCGHSYETLKEMIRPGDLVSYLPEFFCESGVILSKGLFPRVFNEVTIALLEKLKDTEFDYHLAVGCVAQSVIGFRGTKTATYVVRPDAAIALTAFDTAEQKRKLGDGIVIGYYDKQMLPSQRMLQNMVEKMDGKPYFGFMGNDGSFIHKTLTGTPAVSVGIPMANVGTAAEMCLVSDVDVLTEGLVNYLKSLDSRKIIQFGFGDEHD